MADSKHWQCDNEGCFNGEMMEGPGSWYGHAISNGPCPVCARLFRRDQERREEYGDEDDC